MRERSQRIASIITDMPHKAAVIVCAFTMKRYDQIIKCIKSVTEGSLLPGELVLVVDNNTQLEEALRAKTDKDQVRVISNRGRGVADGRSTGISVCRSDVMVFLDDDAWAETDWLQELMSGFDDPRVVGAGGFILPDWAVTDPRLPEELWWAVGATYRGHPTGRVPITRPFGGNMAARREALIEVGGFPSEFGPKDGKRRSSNEELALSAALRRRFGPNSILFVPGAIVRHHVPPERTTWRYLLSRSWVEGTSKADARRQFGRVEMGHDSRYVKQTLLPGALGYLGRALRFRSQTDLREGGMCLASLGVAAAGYGYRLGLAGTSVSATPDTKVGAL